MKEGAILQTQLLPKLQATTITQIFYVEEGNHRIPGGLSNLELCNNLEYHHDHLIFQIQLSNRSRSITTNWSELVVSEASSFENIQNLKPLEIFIKTKSSKEYFNEPWC
jgi:hypothetical protein